MEKEQIIKYFKLAFGKEKDDRIHAIAMVLIYVVLLLFLALFFRFNPSTKNKTNTIKPSPSPSEVIVSPTPSTDIPDKIESFDINYSYIYTITYDSGKEIITGQKIDEKEKFTIITNQGTNDYAKLSDNYLIKGDEDYSIIENPSEYFDYCDVDIILDILKDYSPVNGIYSVKTEDLIKTFDDSTYTGYNGTFNNIEVIINNNQLSKIIMDLSNYISLSSSKNTKNLKIVMEFNDIGTTKDFNIMEE